MDHSRDAAKERLFAVDKDSGVPVWLQLRNRLVYLITSGHYAVGDKIPTVRELAILSGVNYNTASKVYNDIERDGYIVSLRGKGTFVNDGYQADADSDESSVDALADEFIRQLIEIGVVREDIPKIIEDRLGKLGQLGK